jgi:predicted ArsR family transcriptional regulator
MTATTATSKKATGGSAAGGVSVPPPLPAGRRAVLYAVRRIGDATADDIAEALDMTVSGARQHLTSLTEHGLVRTEELRRPDRRGRPQLSYAVTELADALFPKAYGALTNELLGYLDDEDGTTVDRLFARRRDARIANAERRLAPKRRVDRAEPLSHRRAQLRDRRRRPTVRAGVHERARVHPHRPAGRRRRAHAAHGRR